DTGVTTGDSDDGGGPVDGGGASTDSGGATDPCAGQEHAALVINELLSANLHGLLDADGDSSDWIELANLDEVAVDLDGWALSDDANEVPGWALPSSTLEPGEIMLVFASGKDRHGDEEHADFSLSAEGEDLLLRAPDGCVADQVAPIRLYGDISYGRPIAHPDTWSLFMEPTPGQPNRTESRPGFAATPTISPASGFYADPVMASVSSSQDGAVIRYALDGAAPSLTDDIWPGAHQLDTAGDLAVLRARAFVDGLWPSRVATATWGQDRAVLDDGLKIVSLVVDPFDLYDTETGIYTYGLPDYTPDYPYFGANFWEDWERDAHISVWEPDGSLVIDQDVGVKIHGGYTRAFDQKSFRVIARSAYGLDSLDYAFFPDEDQDSFKKIVLEGVGDWCPTHLENALVPQLFRDAEGVRFPTVDAQAWEPTVVYLDGRFWGLYSFREKQDEHYLAEHHGVDPDDLDRVECTADGTDDWWRVNQGSWEAFDALNDFVLAHDLSDPDAWAAFQTMVDVDNLASTVLAEGYWGNTDWWSNNLKLWRERNEDGPFRWMLFDLGHSWPSVSTDHIGTSAAFSGPGLPIADALQNEDFRVLLANQGAEFLATNLAADAALARLDGMAARIEPVISEQYARWCGQPESYWQAQIDDARDFVQRRPAIFRAQIARALELEGQAELTLEADPAGSGSFQLTVIKVAPPFTGTFFSGIPITITAVPSDGRSFSGWSDPDLGDEATTTLTLVGPRRVTALFE
ncbi:MAG: hypothetical protein GXP62_15055, partial [Oligoflexia bacterium]|nr:hypothetical protein [Oligoflexia bacterium]